VGFRAVLESGVKLGKPKIKETLTPSFLGLLGEDCFFVEEAVGVGNKDLKG